MASALLGCLLATGLALTLSAFLVAGYDGTGVLSSNSLAMEFLQQSDWVSLQAALGAHFKGLFLPEQVLAQLVAGVALLVCGFFALATDTTKKLLLVDFHCYRPPDKLKLHISEMQQAVRARGCFSEESLAFMEKVHRHSGLGEVTALSEGILGLQTSGLNQPSHAEAHQESRDVLFDVASNLLEKTGTSPSEIGIVITTCCCFNPTPSMAAMLVNKFKLRSSVLTYHLGGMGCSSSIVAIDLVRHLFNSIPNTLALIVNHENISSQSYIGNERSMLVCNCIFRIGGAAALLSNRPADAKCAKYELKLCQRTHIGADDEAFRAIAIEADAEGQIGPNLKISVLDVAAKALRRNILVFASRVLPVAEALRYVLVEGYNPTFSKAFDHFLLHPGGRGVIEILEKDLRLTPKQAQPSKDALYRFGYTSAATTWYAWSRIESSTGVRKGETVWQIGFGSGFKCGSAVWKARRSIHSRHSCWEGEMVSAGLPGLAEKPGPPSPITSSLGTASFVEEAPTAIAPGPTLFAAGAAGGSGTGGE